MPNDIRNAVSGGHIVVGFFTPNYRELAEAFAANLSAFQQPFHLYAVPSVERWEHATLMKPVIALRAMDDYPDRTIILSDVDCTVHGCLSEMANAGEDVSLHMRTWLKGWIYPYPYACASSRLVAFHPTQKARELAERWRDTNKRTSSKNDEACLTIAISRTIGLTLTTIPTAAGSNERAFDRHPLVTHESAHTSIIGRSGRPVTRNFKKLKRAAFKALTGHDYDHWRYRGTRPASRISSD